MKREEFHEAVRERVNGTVEGSSVICYVTRAREAAASKNKGTKRVMQSGF